MINVRLIIDWSKVQVLQGPPFFIGLYRTVDGQYGYYVTDNSAWVLGRISGTPHASFNKN